MAKRPTKQKPVKKAPAKVSPLARRGNDRTAPPRGQFAKDEPPAHHREEKQYADEAPRTPAPARREPVYQAPAPAKRHPIPQREEDDTRHTNSQRAVAVRKSTALAAPGSYDRFKGKSTGLENVRNQDILIPRLKLLQARNPECVRNDPAYIDGAAEGMFLDTSTKELFEQLELLVCYYEIRFLHWNLREDQGGNGEGLIADLGIDPSCVRGWKYENYAYWQNDPETDQTCVVDTRTFYGMNVFGGIWKPVVWSMTDTQSTPARGWITNMRNYRIPDSDGAMFHAPAFIRSYFGTTRPASKGKNHWVVWNIENGRDIFEIDPTGQLADECEALKELGQSDKLRAETQDTEQQPETRSNSM